MINPTKTRSVADWRDLGHCGVRFRHHGLEAGSSRGGRIISVLLSVFRSIIRPTRRRCTTSRPPTIRRQPLDHRLGRALGSAGDSVDHLKAAVRVDRCRRPAVPRTQNDAGNKRSRRHGRVSSTPCVSGFLVRDRFGNGGLRECPKALVTLANCWRRKGHGSCHPRHPNKVKHLATSEVARCLLKGPAFSDYPSARTKSSLALRKRLRQAIQVKCEGRIQRDAKACHVVPTGCGSDPRRYVVEAIMVERVPSGFVKIRG
jgi:hypothetical protein